MATSYTDIRTSGWVGKLPPALLPYALLARFDRWGIEEDNPEPQV